MSLRRRPVARAVLPPPLPQELHQVHSAEFEKPRFVTANTNTKVERGIVVALTVAAVATRFFRIHQPKAVVFDELHFGAFLEKHLRREVSSRLAVLACFGSGMWFEGFF